MRRPAPLQCRLVPAASARERDLSSCAHNALFYCCSRLRTRQGRRRSFLRGHSARPTNAGQRQQRHYCQRQQQTATEEEAKRREREREKGGALLPADAPRVKGLVTDSSSRRKKEREKNNGEKSRGGRCQPSDSLCFLLRFHSSFFRPALVRSMHDTFCSPYLFFHALLPYTASPLGSEGLGYAWFRKVRFFHPSSVW